MSFQCVFQIVFFFNPEYFSSNNAQKAPIVEEMRLDLEDEDFKAWVGKLFGTLASGSANMGQE